MSHRASYGKSGVRNVDAAAQDNDRRHGEAANAKRGRDLWQRQHVVRCEKLRPRDREGNEGRSEDPEVDLLLSDANTVPRGKHIRRFLLGFA
jgi:hypothetical protein